MGVSIYLSNHMILYNLLYRYYRMYVDTIAIEPI